MYINSVVTLECTLCYSNKAYSFIIKQNVAYMCTLPSLYKGENIMALLLFLKLYSRKKETMDLNKVDKSYNIHSISMKFKTHSISYPHISSSRSRAYRASSLSFYESILLLLCCRTTICNQLNCCKMLALVV